MITKIIPASWLYAGVLILLGVSHLYVYNHAVQVTTAKIEASQLRERERQRVAIDKLNEAWNEKIRQEQIKNLELMKEVRDAEAEAAKDPHRDRPSMSLDGVRRLNKVQ